MSSSRARSRTDDAKEDLFGRMEGAKNPICACGAAEVGLQLLRKAFEARQIARASFFRGAPCYQTRTLFTEDRRDQSRPRQISRPFRNSWGSGSSKLVPTASKPNCRSARIQEPRRRDAWRRRDGIRRQPRRHDSECETCARASARPRSRARPIYSLDPDRRRRAGRVHPLHRGRSTIVVQTRITTREGKLAAIVTQDADGAGEEGVERGRAGKAKASRHCPALLRRARHVRAFARSTDQR